MPGMKAIGQAVSRGFMGRLARDVRGNTIAIMAAAFIPLAGLVGGGIDISRMYITKTRLQHACDAGALAGRKAMGGGTWAQSNGLPNTTAIQFFDANYQTGGYGSSNLARSFSENAGKVSGNASVTLPMTLMRIFGKLSDTLAVTCDAEMRLPNTDVMFVLDTTGSMNDIPVGDTQSKIASLRVAVKCFYEIVARLDTDASCTTGTPSGGTGDQVQIRFGFMPYSTNVNVGKLLPTSYFPDSWYYQSRSPIYATTTTSSWVQSGTPTVTVQNVSYTNIAYANCNDTAAATLNTHDESVNGTTKVATDVTYDAKSWSSANNGTCSGTSTTTKTTYTYKTVTTTTFSKWHYDRISQNVSGLKNGSQWNGSTTLPLGTNGTNKTISWDGCIEERQTVRATSYSPIPSDAYDLDIDKVPTTDTATKWGFALPGMIYTRQGATWNLAAIDSPLDYGNGSAYYCPTEAKKLQPWPDASVFDGYVDSLTPSGNTYHDIGLIWGARFASPTGLFASENAYTPQGGEIQRNIIFMTDGDTNTSVNDYNAYGVPWFDRRQTSASSVPTQANTDDQVNLRFAALCTAVKNKDKNLTLWVISFGAVSTDTAARLQTCATPGRYFSASNAATLQATFASIANQISQLRLTK